MKEYICKEVPTENGGYLEIETELIRCDDCKFYETCIYRMTMMLMGNGYCGNAKRKEDENGK